MKTTLLFGLELYFVNDFVPHHHDYCIQRSQTKRRDHANVHWETGISTREVLRVVNCVWCSLQQCCICCCQVK